MDGGAWKAAVHGVAKSWTPLSDFTFTFHFHALEKEVATHSSVLAWRIPGTGDLVGCRLQGLTESDTTEVTQQQAAGVLWCHLIFQSLNHFEFIFTYGAMEYSNLIVFNVPVYFSFIVVVDTNFFFVYFCLLCHNWLQLDGFISRPFILFHWSMSLFLCQYCNVFIMIALQYYLKSGKVILSTLFSSGLLLPFGAFFGSYKFQYYFFQLCEKCPGYYHRD